MTANLTMTVTLKTLAHPEHEADALAWFLTLGNSGQDADALLADELAVAEDWGVVSEGLSGAAQSLAESETMWEDFEEEFSRWQHELEPAAPSRSFWAEPWQNTCARLGTDTTFARPEKAPPYDPTTWTGKTYLGCLCLNASDFGRDVYSASPYDRNTLGITHRIHCQNDTFWAIKLDIPRKRIAFMNDDESWGRSRSFRCLRNNRENHWIISWEGKYFPEHDPTRGTA